MTDHPVLARRMDEIVGSSIAEQMRRVRDQRLLEGMSATRRKEAQYQGVMVTGKKRPDFATRAVYVRMAYELDGAFPNRLELEVDGQLRTTSDAELMAILMSLGPAPVALPSPVIDSPVEAE